MWKNFAERDHIYLFITWNLFKRHVLFESKLIHKTSEYNTMHRGFNSVRAARCGIREHIYQTTIEFTQPSKTPYRKLNNIYIDGDKTIDRLYIPKHKLLLCRLDWLGRHGSFWWAFGRHGVWSLHPSRWTWPMKLATERPLMRCWWTQAVYFWGAWCPGGSFSFAAFRGCGNGEATRGGHMYLLFFRLHILLYLFLQGADGESKAFWDIRQGNIWKLLFKWMYIFYFNN
jgi:hypothetical protein